MIGYVTLNLNERSTMNRKVPLVVILGATGSGKTKLSLHLAQKFGGEIIGADSMQIYKGLDVITAKATSEERAMAPHHLINELDPHNDMFTVVDFRNKALPIIDEVVGRNNIPIVVGGTNYYIESLLWKILVEKPGKSKLVLPGTCVNKHTLASSELHRMLSDCDPVRARQLHPNDKRKILRSLEVLQQKGRRHSDVLREQQSSEGGSSLGGALRYRNTLIFWLQCEQEALNKRLDSRVDLMLKQGLVDELLNFHKQYNEQRLKTDEAPDYTRGIFQSIGFKEFHKYLMLCPTERLTNNGRALFDKGIDELKRVTRRYAKKQKRWITNRLLSKSDRKVPPVYGLNTTDVVNWNQNVTIPATEIVQSFLSDLTSPHQPLPQQETASFPNSQADTYVCDLCDRLFVGKFQWDAHVKSNKHKRVIVRKNKFAANFKKE